MREGIHPDYVECTVTCACGESFQTHATKPQLSVDICSKCHPFFTGKQKFVDTAGRVEKFQRRYNWKLRTQERPSAEEGPARVPKEMREEGAMTEPTPEEKAAAAAAEAAEAEETKR
jgi:large subunit ribosomal protein L31